jgi:hypothetical protein
LATETRSTTPSNGAATVARFELRALESHRCALHAGLRVRVRASGRRRSLAARERLRDDLFEETKLCFLDGRFCLLHREVERASIESHEGLARTDSIARAHEDFFNGSGQLGPERCFAIGSDLTGRCHGQDEIAVANLRGRDRKGDVGSRFGRGGVAGTGRSGGRVRGFGGFFRAGRRCRERHDEREQRGRDAKTHRKHCPQ